MDGKGEDEEGEIGETKWIGKEVNIKEGEVEHDELGEEIRTHRRPSANTDEHFTHPAVG